LNKYFRHILLFIIALTSLYSADFNNDGIPDLIFKNDKGYIKTWELDSSYAKVKERWLTNLGSDDWELYEDIVDVNNDNSIDIILQQTSTGYIKVLQMNGFSKRGIKWTGNPGSDWEIVGVSDIDGDNYKDMILQQESTGYLKAFKLNSDSKGTAKWIGDPAGKEWEVVKVADVDGDGIADIVMQNSSNGYIKAFKLDSNFKATAKWIGNPNGTNWDIEGVKDIDGDGICDIVLQDENNGYIKAFKLNSSFKASAKWIGSPGINYEIQDVEDIDGDGTSDILLRDKTKGYVKAFQLNNSTLKGTAKWIGNPSGVEWKIVEVSDVDDDGIQDVVMQNSRLGYVKAFKLNSSFKGTAKWIGNPGSSTWQIDITGDASKVSSGDDHSDTAIDATTISLNSTISGNIEELGDEDYFKIVVLSSGALTISTTGDTDTYGILYDVSGHKVSVDSNFGIKNNFKITKLINAGTYYIKVRCLGSTTGKYSLISSFETGAFDNDGDSAPDATTISPDSNISRDIEEPGDIDYFKIVVPSAGRLTVHTTGDTNTLGALFDSSGNMLLYDDNTGINSNFKITKLIKAGTYFVQIKGRYNYEIGAYSLVSSFEIGIFDNHGSNSTYATNISSNSITSGEIEERGDVDYFKIVVESKGILTVYTTGNTATLGRLNGPVFKIKHNNNSGVNDNFKISRLLDAGTYYISVEGDEEITTGAYTLVSSFVVEPEDQGDTIANATPIPLDSNTFGTIEESEDVDVDYFKIVVPSAGRLSISTKGDTHTYGTLYDSSGNSLASEDYSNGGEYPNFKIIKLLKAGTYYVQVKGTYSYKTGAYSLVSSFEVGIFDNHGDTMEDATTISLDSVTLGGLEEVEDIDYFKIVVPSAGKLTITATGDTNTYGTLYDSSGKRLADRDNGGTNYNFEIITLLDAGTYYVKVDGGSLERMGSYSLVSSFEEGVYDNHGDNIADATTINLNSTTSGDIEKTEDKDYFKIVLPSDGRLTVNTTGDTTTYGTLYDSSGNSLISRYNGGTNYNFKIIKLLKAGTYYIEVKGSIYYTPATGVYSLVSNFEIGISDNHGDTTLEATTINLNSTTSGNIGEPGDKDYFKIVVPSAGALTITTIGDTNIEGALYDSSGNSVSYNDDDGVNSNFKILKLLRAGTYYIKVEGDSYDDIGAYSLVSSFFKAGPETDIYSDVAQVPHNKFSIPLLGILLNYNNASIVSSDTIWSSKLFGENEEQLNHYFKEVSNSQFKFTKVLENSGILNDGIASVTLNKSHPNISIENSSYQDIIHKDLKTAIEYLDSMIDFSNYDVDANGYITPDELSVTFVMAGYEDAYEGRHVTDGTWAHASCISSDLAPKVDGVSVLNCSANSEYAIFGERHNVISPHDATIGIIAHELAHSAFALPDLYNTLSSTGDKGNFNFGLMGAGLWGSEPYYKDAGSTPVHFSAWSKVYMGWVTPTEASGSESLFAASSSNYNVLKISIDSDNYYLLENRDNSGYDRGFYHLDKNFKGGMAIWMINKNKLTDSDFSDNTVNTITSDKGVGLATDSLLYSPDATTFETKVTNISEPGSTMTLNIK